MGWHRSVISKEFASPLMPAFVVVHELLIVSIFLNFEFTIEAAIVRIMKARKKLSHNVLVTEVSCPVCVFLCIPIFRCDER